MRFLLLWLMLIAPHAWSADSAGAYTGTAPTCETVVAAERNRDKSEMSKIRWITIAWWVHGYVVAYNTFTPDTYDIMGDADLNSVLRWLSIWCEKNPQRNSGHGMEVLIRELYPQRHKTAKKPRG
jgi:hypothetical protein